MELSCARAIDLTRVGASGLTPVGARVLTLVGAIGADGVPRAVGVKRCESLGAWSG